MANFLSLVKVQFLSYLGINKLLRSKKKKKMLGAGGISILMLVFFAFFAFMGYTYANIFSDLLKSTNNSDKLVPFMISIASILCFVFSFYAVGGAIFGFKDYDMLMSMPIKPKAIVLSKFAFLYVSDLVVTLLISLPSLFVYNNVVGSISFMQVISCLVSCIVAPLLPIAISTALGMGVYYVSSKFRRKNIIQIILLMLFMIVIFALSFMSGFLSEGENSAIIMSSLNVIGSVYFILPILELAFNSSLWLFAFIGVNLIPVIIVVVFVCCFYKKLNTIFSAKKTLRNFKLKEYGTSSINKLLLNKEIKRLFSSPIYAVNSLMGAVLGVVISIAYCIMFAVLKQEFNGQPEIAQLFVIISRMMPAMFAFMFMLTPTTNSSISLEGQAFWVIKTAPIKFAKICFAKLALNGIFNIIPAFISSLLIVICTQMNFLDGLLFVIIALLLATFGGAFGLLMNLRFPKMKWKNENEPVKQGLPVLFTMLSAFVMVIILVVMAIFVPIGLSLLFIIFTSMLLVFNIIIFLLLFRFGEKLFNKIN